MNLYKAILSYFGFFNPVHYSKVKKNKNKTKNKDLSNEKNWRYVYLFISCAE